MITEATLLIKTPLVTDLSRLYSENCHRNRVLPCLLSYLKRVPASVFQMLSVNSKRKEELFSTIKIDSFANLFLMWSPAVCQNMALEDRETLSSFSRIFCVTACYVFKRHQSTLFQHSVDRQLQKSKRECHKQILE